MKTLSIIYTLVDWELPAFKQAIRESVENGLAWQSDILAVIVVQSEQDLPPLDIPDGIEHLIVRMGRHGVSAARNIGLQSAQDRSRYVVFADCRTVFSQAFLEAALDGRHMGKIWVANVQWSSIKGAERVRPPKAERFDPLKIAYEGFLWRCVFRMDALKGCRFRETIGPGSEGPIQSGEDSLFMADVISFNKIDEAIFDPRAYVRCLERTSVPAKQLRYAYGAGFRVGVLLSRNFSVQRTFYVAYKAILFTTKSICSLAGRSEKRQIGMRRLKGLWRGLVDPKSY